MFKHLAQEWGAAGGDLRATTPRTGRRTRVATGQSEAALRKAAWQGRTEDVRVLLAAETNPDAAGSGGITALMSAAYDGHAEPCAVLLEGGASIDAANDDGDTALMLAAGKGEEECVRVLLAAGAGTSVGGKSAASIAEINGRSELAAMIRLHENRSRRTCSPRGVSSPGKGLVETVEAGEEEGAVLAH